MPAQTPTRSSNRPPTRQDLPKFRVILHNDDVHDMAFVTDTLRLAMPFSASDAWRLMFVAHHYGKSLLVTVHQELAELYRDKLRSRGLTVSLEAA
ncbi:MAG: ATP-dependent Clp protease adaptor ClpS [Planctomycetota bacterium]